MEPISGLVSITIPIYNAERFLRETIESVFAQSYTHWELLLSDDGSTDRSSEIARACAALHPDKIFYLEHPRRQNLGAPATRNLGARHSRGEFLAFLDSDDIWLPGKLEANVSSLIKQPQAGLLFGSTEYWYEWDPEGNNHQKNLVPFLAPAGKLYHPPELLTQSYPLGPYGAPCPSSFLLRRWAFDLVGGFEECFNPATYQLYDDIAFLAKLYLCVPVYISAACLDKNRCNRFSMSRQNSTVRAEEAARRYFFRWFIGHLRSYPVVDRAIWMAVCRQSWFYLAPLPAAKLLRRVAAKLSRLKSKRWPAAANRIADSYNAPMTDK